MKHQEYELQCQFCQLLDYHNIFYFAVPNQEVRGGTELQRIIAYKRLKKSGNKKGASDLVIVLKNKVVFCEMKTEKGKQSEEQKDFEKKVKELGHEYIVLHNIDDCLNFIKFFARKHSGSLAVE